MARNYEAVREALRLNGETKLQLLDEAFQGHQSWLCQAVEELKVQAADCLPQAQEQPQRASRGRSKAADKVGQAMPTLQLLHTLFSEGSPCEANSRWLHRRTRVKRLHRSEAPGEEAAGRRCWRAWQRRRIQRRRSKTQVQLQRSPEGPGSSWLMQRQGHQCRLLLRPPQVGLAQPCALHSLAMSHSLLAHRSQLTMTVQIHGLQAKMQSLPRSREQRRSM